MSLLNANIDHFPAWHPFLINEDVHSLAIDLALRKVANATFTVLALMRASDLSQQHEISNKLKDFLQCAWACKVSSGTHIALVKTTIDKWVITVQEAHILLTMADLGCHSKTIMSSPNCKLTCI
jgi:hypothetical protein